MQDLQGTAVTVGAVVTLTGTVTAVTDQSVTIDVPAPVFHEYPKMLESGVIATSKAHEAELTAAAKAPEPETPKKAKATK